MLAPSGRDKHRAYVAGGVVQNVIGSTTVKGFHKARPIRSLSCEVMASTGAVAARALWHTWKDNADGTLTIYLWKATAANDNTPIASTAAVDIVWRAEYD